MKASARKKLRAAKTAEVRRQVMERANGSCEHCGVSAWVLELDHVFGGSQRRLLESVETCWALCRTCHRSKTDNSPSRAFWLESFIAHALRHGYLAEADLARGKLAMACLKSGDRDPGDPRS